MIVCVLHVCESVCLWIEKTEMKNDNFSQKNYADSFLNTLHQWFSNCGTRTITAL